MHLQDQPGGVSPTPTLTMIRSQYISTLAAATASGFFGASTNICQQGTSQVLNTATYNTVGHIALCGMDPELRSDSTLDWTAWDKWLSVSNETTAAAWQHGRHHDQLRRHRHGQRADYPDAMPTRAAAMWASSVTSSRGPTATAASTRQGCCHLPRHRQRRRRAAGHCAWGPCTPRLL